jgi:hypothetical protein
VAPQTAEVTDCHDEVPQKVRPTLTVTVELAMPKLVPDSVIDKPAVSAKF